jgi:hypothetical protein
MKKLSEVFVIKEEEEDLGVEISQMGDVESVYKKVIAFVQLQQKRIVAAAKENPDQTKVAKAVIEQLQIAEKSLVAAAKVIRMSMSDH